MRYSLMSMVTLREGGEGDQGEDWQGNRGREGQREGRGAGKEETPDAPIRDLSNWQMKSTLMIPVDKRKIQKNEAWEVVNDEYLKTMFPQTCLLQSRAEIRWKIIHHVENHTKDWSCEILKCTNKDIFPWLTCRWSRERSCSGIQDMLCVVIYLVQSLAPRRIISVCLHPASYFLVRHFPGSNSLLIPRTRLTVKVEGVARVHRLHPCAADSFNSHPSSTVTCGAHSA